MLAPPRSDGTAQHNAFLGWVTSSRVCRPKPPPSARCVMAQPAQVFRELLRENGRAHCVLDHSCDATPTRRSARAGRCAIPRSSSLMRRAGIEPPVTPRRGSFVSARPVDETRLSARGHGSREAFRRVADRTTPPVVICVPSDQVERLNPSFQNTGANGIPLARSFSEVGWLGRLRGRCEPTVEDCGCASGDDYPLAHDFDAD
jgi:hypothetical protein